MVVPEYLKKRYGDVKVPRGGHSEPTPSTNPTSTRKKLHVVKIDTVADRINEEFRDLLSKISEQNRTQLMADLVKMEIPDECGVVLIDNIYRYVIDLTCLLQLHIYVDVIFVLKEKNLHLFQQLIDRIIKTAREPLPETEQVETVKRSRIGNVHLLSEIYLRDSSVISSQVIMEVAIFLMGLSSPQKTDYIDLLCELLKRVIISLKRPPVLQQFLEKVKADHSYDKKSRFKVQDILELGGGTSSPLNPPLRKGETL